MNATPHPPSCPVQPGPLDFTQPIFCHWERVKTIRELAASKGFKVIRCSLCGALYKLEFALAGNQPESSASNADGLRLADNQSQVTQDVARKAAGNCYTPQIRMRLA